LAASDLAAGPCAGQVHAAGATAGAATPIRDVTPTIAFQRGLWELLMDRITVENVQTLRAATTDQLTVHETSRDARAIARVLQATSGVRVTPKRADSHRTTQRCVPLRRHPARRSPRSSRAVRTVCPAHTRSGGLTPDALAAAGHPTILRALGLILELRLNASELTSHAGGTVRVKWPGTQRRCPGRSPRTRSGRSSGRVPPTSTPGCMLDRLDASGRAAGTS
jgi:hypothetical protein